MITYEKSKTNEKNQNSDPNPVVTTKMNARLGVKTDVRFTLKWFKVAPTLTSLKSRLRTRLSATASP